MFIMEMTTKSLLLNFDDMLLLLYLSDVFEDFSNVKMVS